MVNQGEEAMKSEPLININSRVDDSDSLSEEVGIIHHQLQDEVIVAGRLQKQRLDKYVCCIKMMFYIFVYRYL